MYSPISTIGKKYLVVYVILLLLDVVVVALATRVNIFQEFFFVADLLPLGLSVATLVALSLSIFVDLTFYNTLVSRPAFKIGFCFVLSVLWLAFNIFSTARWGNIPMPCSSVPSDLTDERSWCEDVQALKTFVWVFFVGVLLISVFMARYTILQHRRGNISVWKYSVIRYDLYTSNLDTNRAPRPETVTDYFASSTENAIAGPPLGAKW